MLVKTVSYQYRERLKFMLRRLSTVSWLSLTVTLKPIHPLIVSEFREERRMLLEVVGPELQSLYDDRQIEIEMIDMHFGTGPTESAVDVDPRLLTDHLSEISCCKRESKSVFFLVSIF